MKTTTLLSIACSLFLINSLYAQKNNRTASPSSHFRKNNMSSEQRAISLFKISSKTSSINVEKDIKNAVFLELDQTQLDLINQQKPVSLIVTLPLSETSSATFYLKQTKLLSDNFSLVTDKNERIPYSPGLYYQGTVAGNTPSLAAWSLFSKSVITVFSWNNENFNLGLWNDPSNVDKTIYILYKDSDVQFERHFECHSEKLKNSSHGAPKAIIQHQQTQFTNCIKVYFECDYQMYQDNGNSTTNVANFVTGFFNSVQTMYANESIGIEISQIYTWTSSDPYIPNTTSTDLLNNFQATRTTFNGDVAHLLTTRNLNAGGLAYLNVLCTPSYAYGISNIDNNYVAYPTFSWTTEVVTHELGHNVGSHHTHWCGWPGGAIDDCYTTEGGCAAGPHPTNGGTIMSYCHLTNTGIVLTNGFGPMPGDTIRACYAAAACLTACTPNDPVCANTTSISACGSANSQTFTSGGTGTWNNSTASACGSAAPGTEKVFTFTPSASGTYSIQVTSASGNVHYEWKASACGTTGWTCIANINTAGQYGTMAWTAGTTYYILLDDEDVTAGTHNFYINCLPPSGSCTTIDSISACGSSNSKTFTGGPNGLWNAAHSSCGLYPAPGIEKIYKFTPAATGIYKLHITAATGYVDYLWKTGNPCDSTGWTCIEDTNLIGQYGALNWTAGTTYYILLDDEYVGSTASNHTFYFSCPGDTTSNTSPCSNITSISSCGTNYSQTFTGGTTGSWNSTTANACGYGSPGAEHLYSFTPAVSGTYSIQITSATGYVDYLWKTGSCDSAGWTCITDTNANGQYGAMSWTAGTTYYILLDDEAVGGNISTHSFYINCANTGANPCSNIISIAACGANSTQTYIGGGSGAWNTSSNDACGHSAPGTEQIYSFTPTVTGIYSIQVTAANGYVDYQWKSGSCAGSGWNCIANINAVGQYGNLALTSGTTYYFLLDDENSITGTHSFYVKCIENNPCANVTLIPACGSVNTQTYTGGGSGFWNASTNNACNATSPGIENIFSFTPTASGVYSIHVTDANGKVDYLWKATTCSPSGWNCIAAVDLPGQYGSMLWTANTTYYILLDDENAAQGTHNFYVDCANVVQGVAENALNDFVLQVIPNPNNGAFSITLNNLKSDKIQISIFNMLGQSVYVSGAENINGKISKDLFLNNLAEGIYTININADAKQYHKKIIINK